MPGIPANDGRDFARQNLIPPAFPRIFPQFLFLLKSLYPVSCARRRKRFPAHGLALDWQERVIMESGVCERMETANLPSLFGILLSSVGQILLLPLGWILAVWPDMTAAARAVAPMDSGKRLKMQIIIFSVKFNKFTGFFDKFPKIISPGNDCNQKGYHINMSVSHSDPAAKKVFRPPRISPQQPAFPLLPT